MVSWWGSVIFDGPVQLNGKMQLLYVLVQLLWGTNCRCTVAIDRYSPFPPNCLKRRTQRGPEENEANK